MIGSQNDVGGQRWELAINSPSHVARIHVTGVGYYTTYRRSGLSYRRHLRPGRQILIQVMRQSLRSRRIEAAGYCRTTDKRGLHDAALRFFVFHADSQSAKKLGILVGEAELLGLGWAASRTGQLLAVYQVAFVAFVEAYGDFEHQEEVITGGADATHHIGNPFGIRKRFVDRLTEFLDQPLKVIVEVQKPPGLSLVALLHQEIW